MIMFFQPNVLYVIYFRFIYYVILNVYQEDLYLFCNCPVVCLSGSDFTIDDQCLLSLLKGLCLKHLGHHEEAEHYFTLVLCK